MNLAISLLVLTLSALLGSFLEKNYQTTPAMFWTLGSLTMLLCMRIIYHDRL